METPNTPSSHDFESPVQIADRLWWVGHMDEDDQFQCHVYLLENGDESVLFDPGSKLLWPQVRAKIEAVVPLSSIKWVVCHHQDPDIVGALPDLVAEIDRDDLHLVTHWRTWAVLKHLGVRCRVWDIEANGWVLDLGGRRIEFVLTPYLHFAGAFTSFDHETGTLMTSDLCGGFSDASELFMSDLDALDGVEAFHQHYMPSRDILMAGILELERLPVRCVAPQHGHIIPEEFIEPVFSRLKALDCGLFLLQVGGDDFGQLQVYNRILKDTMATLANEQDFSAVAKRFSVGLQQVLPVRALNFMVPWDDGRWLKLSPQNLFQGEVIDQWPCGDLLEDSNESWCEMFGSEDAIVTSAMLVENGVEANCMGPSLMTRLWSMLEDKVQGMLVIQTKSEQTIEPGLAEVMNRLFAPMSVALDRELVRRRLETERDQIFERSIRDPLTGLYTRRYMDDVVARLVGASERESIPGIALLMFDVDLFKRVNDTYGHPVGDDVLRTLADIMFKTCRDADIPVRYGGEEFAFFLITNQEDVAVKAAERIRKVLSDHVFKIEGDEFHVTASVGVALHVHGSDLKDLISRADKALYQAKETGRDKVCVFHEAEEPVELGQV